jgi:hypothetical protein
MKLLHAVVRDFAPLDVEPLKITKTGAVLHDLDDGLIRDFLADCIKAYELVLAPDRG